ncbi:MAG: GGDEF domain-containing protein [Pseudomonadota bacterium]
MIQSPFYNKNIEKVAVITQHTIHYRPEAYISLRSKLREMVQRVNPQDIISTRFHSDDFNTSRAEYVSIRLRLLAIAFAVLAPLWIPIDYFVMNDPVFTYIVLLRLAFSAAFLALSRWGTNCNRLSAARLRLFFFIMIPGLFFFLTHMILTGTTEEHGILLGYSFLPFLIMALLTIVPLTFLEGLGCSGLIILIFITTKLSQGTLNTIPAMGDLWLLLLLTIIALWVQMTQLHMLMRLYREATRDALTGLVNRRVLTTKLEEETALSDTSNEPLSVLLFDLDLFKRVNDTYGHHAGDTVLQAFAQVLQRHCGDSHLVGRYGGEEFLAILPGADVEAAHQCAERIRLACHDYTVHTEEDHSKITFTTSIGVALRKADETAHDLLSRVDQGLYKAKSSGRDLVAIAD